MKRFLLGAMALVVGMGFFPNSIQAQSVHTVIKTRPLAPIAHAATLAIEQTVAPRLSVQVETRYQWKSWLDGEGSSDFSRLRITPELRVYARPSMARNGAPEGFFFGPFMRYTRTQRSSNGFGRSDFLGGGGQIGYQAIVAGHLSMGVFGGLGLGRYLETGVPGSWTNVPTSLPLPIWRLGFSMGVGF